jgi:hypothetical protein
MDRALKIKCRVVKLDFIKGHYRGTDLAESLKVSHGIPLFRKIQIHYSNLACSYKSKLTIAALVLT